MENTPFWTDATSPDLDLPDVDLFDALGLRFDAPAPADENQRENASLIADQPAVSDGTLPWEDSKEMKAVKLEPSESDYKDIIADLRRKNEKLRASLQDSKDLLLLYNRQEKELKALRKRLATVEVERARLSGEMGAMQAAAARSRGSEPPTKRPRSSSAGQPVTQGSMLVESHLDAIGLPCCSCSLRNSPHTGLPKESEHQRIKPMLGVTALKEWLRNAAAGEMGEFCMLHAKHDELVDLRRLVVSAEDMLTSAHAAATVFHSSLLDTDNTPQERIVLQILGYASCVGDKNQTEGVTDLADIVLNLLKATIKDPRAPSAKAIRAIRVLFRGARTGTWKGYDPVMSLARFLVDRMAVDEDLCRTVLASNREDIIAVLDMVGGDPALEIICSSLVAVIRRQVGQCGIREDLCESLRRVEQDSERVKLTMRCRRILSSAVEACESKVRVTCALALTLECVFQTAETCYEIVLNGVLWAAISGTISDLSQFRSLLQLVGPVGSLLSKQKSATICEGVRSLLHRLTAMLCIPEILPQMRAAVLDTVIAIVSNREDHFYRDTMCVLKTWRTTKCAVSDFKYVTRTTEEYLQKLKLAP